MAGGAPADFTALWNRLRGIDFFGRAGAPMPAGDALTQALKDGAPLLPLAYGDAFVTPVTSGLARLLGLARTGQIHAGSVEMVTGAIYQHGPGGQLVAPLRRFNAVISDLYESFLADTRRSASGIALSGTLPPLAVFQHDGSDGPITIAIDLIARVLGGGAGVVGLPATLADHPVLWAALAHETGGHDVTHADPGLLDQLAGGLAGALAGLPGAGAMPIGDVAALWGYWIDEATADVYGLLNVGPGFADNLAVFLAAMAGGTAPALRMACRADPADPTAMLDPHPADILRLHLLLGAIDSLAQLAPATRAGHVRRIEALAAALAKGDTVTIDGNIQDAAGRPRRLRAQVSLAAMQQAARALGGFIATAALPALGGKSIQAIETWDDADEAIVQAIRGALLAGQPVIGLGDDAQLLAAANFAAFDRPDQYDAITASLNAALDQSFRTDPIWGTLEVDRLYLRY